MYFNKLEIIVRILADGEPVICQCLSGRLGLWLFVFAINFRGLAN
jgi:hypothetical protein